MWTDIAAIVFICTTINHLGLIMEVEKIVGHGLPIINCPKCFTFWFVLAYQMVMGSHLLMSLAISFLCAYLAIWLELLEGIVDYLYNYIYGKIFSATDTADTDAERT